MKYIIIVAILSLMSLSVLATNIDESSIDWFFNTNMEDDFIQVNLTEVEDEIINVKINQKQSLQNYEFSIALCNVTGFNFSIKGKEFPYVRLADYGYPEWCQETNNYGFLTHFKIPKSALPLDINITIPEKIMKILPHFYFYAGNSTSIIDASASATATQINTNENIAKDSNGFLQATWISNGSDLSYGNSTDGITWSAKKVLKDTGNPPIVSPFSAIRAGILTNSNDYLYIYYIDKSVLQVGSVGYPKIMNSTNKGLNWSNSRNLFSNNNHDAVSCVLDSNDIIHCCGISVNDTLYYVNSTVWGTDTIVNANMSDDTDYCDIEIDNNSNIYIVGLGTDDRDVDLWASSIGWGSADRITVAEDTLPIFETSATPYAPSIAMDNSNNVYIAYSNQGDLYLANSSVSHIRSFSTKLIDSQDSFFPDIAVNHLGDLHILCQDAKNLNVSTEIYHAYAFINGNWSSRKLLQNSSGYPSIADTNYPKSNRMSNTLRYVFTNSSSSVLYDEIIVDTCTSPLNENWNVRLEDNCINAVERNLNKYNVTITGNGTFTTLAKIYNITNLEVKSNQYNVTCRGGCFWI